MGAIDIAEVMLSNAMRRVDVAAQNLANVTTPGYKAHNVFSFDPKSRAAAPSAIDLSSVDLANGKLQQTGNPFDLAIEGGGFFVAGSPDGLFFTRNGQFHRDQDGNLATADGLLLQSADGEIRLGTGDFTVLSDGEILQGGEPVSRLRVVTFDDRKDLKVAGNGLLTAPEEAAREVSDAQIRQGMIETSNVVTADQMITIMAALRSAESSQRVVQVYDDLMGRVLTTFGQ
jgi:flagellar basal-body rod protein FlgG